MKHGFNWLAFVMILVLSSVSSQTAPRQSSPSFKLEGQITNPRTYTLQDIQALPTKEVKLEYTAANQLQKHSFKGTSLFDLIVAAMPQFDAKIKNDALRWVVQARGSDGYTATFALGELDPNFGNKGVLVVYQQDAAPLAPEDGLMRLIVPGDVKGGRFIGALTSITIKRIE